MVVDSFLHLALSNISSHQEDPGAKMPYVWSRKEGMKKVECLASHIACHWHSSPSHFAALPLRSESRDRYGDMAGFLR